jgi:murein DD-endopeptidase MepM/ murein hydrolase activator NlpD
MPGTATEGSTELAPPRISLETPVPQGKNSLVDSTDYSPRRTSVIFSDRQNRSPMAQTGRRQSLRTARSLLRRQTAIASGSITPRYRRLARRSRVSGESLVSRVSNNNVNLASTRNYTAPPRRLRTHQYQATGVGQPIASNQVFSLEPIVRRGVAIALAPLPEYSRASTLAAPTPQAQPQTNTDLLFPVAAIAPITSAFGWRVHPITGQGRMHSGTDIGAPTGTPVLAAYAGEVATADWLGGYGMTVILKHLDGSQESRYAHLSEILVQPGQKVQQGEIIGRVGSTGLSTGPHLHFEWRHLTKDGWVAVDAGQHLEYALENMIRAQSLAKAATQPQG